ncbi:MAG: ester cyclase [Chloroflexota bacterium]
MGTDKVRLAKEGIDAFSAGDWERFKAPLSSDAVYEELATQRKVQGPDEIVEATKGWKEAFPDAKGTITKVTEGSDTVVLEITWEGTHTGDLISSMGAIPPSQKRVKIPAVQVVRFKGDKVVETRHFFDLMTLLAQIGALPVPATA